MTKRKSLYNIKMSTLGIGPYDLNQPYGATTMNCKEHVIEGKMFVHHMEIPDYQLLSMSDDDIKGTLIRDLTEQLVASNCVEFTKIQNMQNMNWHFRARIFVTPNDQVCILREAGY